MKITTEMVKELRDATGAGFLDVKKALEKADGDFDKAIETLREKGVAQAAKRADRLALEGVIEVYSHPGNRVAVILELNCETDFVARNEIFRDLAHDLALHIAAMAPKYLTPEDIPEEELQPVIAGMRAQALSEGKPEAVVDKIVNGRLEKFFEESCLTEQPFVKDEDVKVKDLVTKAIAALGENIVVRRFERYELGEQLS